MTSAEQGETVAEAARSTVARVLGWAAGGAALAGAAAAALLDQHLTVVLGIASGGLLVALGLAGYLEQRARDRLRASWLERLNRLTLELAGVTDASDPFDLVGAAAEQALEGDDGPRAMGPERAAFTRSVADQCAQALERLELQESRRQAGADLELLARASPALAASLDVQRVASTLEDLVVPLMADTCSLRVIRSRAARQDRPVAAHEDLSEDGHSCVFPLRAHGELVGEVTVYRHARALTGAERTSVRMLAEPAARAIAHGLRFTEQVRTSDTLQHSLLPEAVLPVAHLEVATRYLAATEGQAVGGDFYDVIQAPGGGAVLVVGDVQGKGVEAAALTSAARHTLRTCALQGDRPAQMLGRLNEALLYQQAERALAHPRPSVRFVTVSVVALTPTATGFEATVASGGHPPPLVITPEGGVEQISTDGPLLGVFGDPSFLERTVLLGLADVLVLYTDGVVEQREQPELFDETQLGRLVRNMLSERHAEVVAQLILDTVVDLGPREVRDDIALVVARVTGPR